MLLFTMANACGIFCCALESWHFGVLISKPENLCSFAWRLSRPPGAWSTTGARKLKHYHPQQPTNNNGWKLMYNYPRSPFPRWGNWRAPFTLAPRVWVPAAHNGNLPIMHPLLTGCLSIPVLVSSLHLNIFQDHLPNKLLLAYKSYSQSLLPGLA